jgi:hypothetical protein
MMISPVLIAFLAAELFFLVARSKDFTTLIKRENQRTPREHNRVTRGLLRSTLLEALVYVPASTALLELLQPLLLPSTLELRQLQAVHALIGLVSYGFPFTAIRLLFTKIALSTLKELGDAAAIAARESADD